MPGHEPCPDDAHAQHQQLRNPQVAVQRWPLHHAKDPSQQSLCTSQVWMTGSLPCQVQSRGQARVLLWHSTLHHPRRVDQVVCSLDHNTFCLMYRSPIVSYISAGPPRWHGYFARSDCICLFYQSHTWARSISSTVYPCLNIQEGCKKVGRSRTFEGLVESTPASLARWSVYPVTWDIPLGPGCRQTFLLNKIRVLIQYKDIILPVKEIPLWR